MLPVLYFVHGNERPVTKEQDAMKGAYLGPEFSVAEIEAELNHCGAVYRKCSKRTYRRKVAAAIS